MATLQLVWDHRRAYDLWSWSMGNIHQTARIIKCIKNRVYTAHLGPRGMEANEVVIVKAALGPDEMVLLNREAEFYASELLDLQGVEIKVREYNESEKRQICRIRVWPRIVAENTCIAQARTSSGIRIPTQGTVVPKCFGFFRGKVNGVDFGCLLLEYCSGRAPVWNMQEFNRHIMLSVCRIHKAGIIHGDLLDGHHFVKMGDGVRIIDFSSAMRHQCRNGIPKLIHGRDADGQCKELVNVEKTFGFRSDITGRRVQRFWS